MRRSSFLVRFILIGILLHIYVGLRLIPDMPVSAAGRWLCALWLVLSIFLIPLGMLARTIKQQPLSDRLAWVGLLAMGFFSSLLVLTLARDLALASLLTVDAIWPNTIAIARWRIGSAAAVPLLALLSTLVGLFNARRRARVVTIEVPIDDLPAALNGFTIVQISDIHVGPTIKGRYVDAIVDAVNRLKPDLIAVTGDVVDGSVPQLTRHTQPLSRLSARHGAFLVTGNHEYYAGANAWIDEFRRLGLNVLLNEHVIVEHDGARAVIAGVTDYSAGHHDPLASQRPGCGPRRRAWRRADQSTARAPATLGRSSCSSRFHTAAIRPYARRPVLPVEFLCAFPAAVHGWSGTAERPVGLHESRHRLLGDRRSAWGPPRRSRDCASCPASPTEASSRASDIAAPKSYWIAR
jgi:Predicted phosphohydrolases